MLAGGAAVFEDRVHLLLTCAALLKAGEFVMLQWAVYGTNLQLSQVVQIFLVSSVSLASDQVVSVSRGHCSQVGCLVLIASFSFLLKVVVLGSLGCFLLLSFSSCGVGKAHVLLSLE
jgi:hypothetical protein